MKSRINLYLPELHPKLEVLTLSFVLTVGNFIHDCWAGLLS